MNAVVDQLLERRHHVAVGGNADLFQDELLIEELAGGVVVRDGEASACESFIFRWHVEIGNFRWSLDDLAEISQHDQVRFLCDTGLGRDHQDARYQREDGRNDAGRFPPQPGPGSLDRYQTWKQGGPPNLFYP